MAEDVETFWRRILTTELPRFVPPLEQLVVDSPQLFDPENAEAQAPLPSGSFQDERCGQCQEQRSPSGWGTPGCVLCGEVEELCLPIDEHIFAGLLRTPVAEEEHPMGRQLSEGGEDLASLVEDSQASMYEGY